MKPALICALTLLVHGRAVVSYQRGREIRHEARTTYEYVLVQLDKGSTRWFLENDCFYTPESVAQAEIEYRMTIQTVDTAELREWRQLPVKAK